MSYFRLTGSKGQHGVTVIQVQSSMLKGSNNWKDIENRCYNSWDIVPFPVEPEVRLTWGHGNPSSLLNAQGVYKWKEIENMWHWSSLNTWWRYNTTIWLCTLVYFVMYDCAKSKCCNEDVMFLTTCSVMLTFVLLEILFMKQTVKCVTNRFKNG